MPLIVPVRASNTSIKTVNIVGADAKLVAAAERVV